MVHPSLSLQTEKRRPLRLLLAFVLLVYGLLCVLPFVFMLSSSLKPAGQVFEYPINLIPKTWMWSNYAELFSPDYLFLQWYANTLVMEVLVITLKLLVTGITAYAFARLRFKGRDQIFVILLMTLMIPSEVTLIPKYIVYKHLMITDSMWALIFPYVFEVFLVFLVRQFYLTIPFELSEAALIDGCNHWQIFYRIILPNSKPAMITMLLFTFVWSWNDFSTPFIFITDQKKQMLSVGIQYFQTLQYDNYAMQMAAASLILVPVILIFLLAQKYFIEGIATSGIKG